MVRGAEDDRGANIATYAYVEKFQLFIVRTHKHTAHSARHDPHVASGGSQNRAPVRVGMCGLSRRAFAICIYIFIYLMAKAAHA